MDGKRIQNYWSNEMQAMLDTYKQFQILIPAENRNGAAHNGEDGRYVETLMREYLKRYCTIDCLFRKLLSNKNEQKKTSKSVWDLEA